MNAFPAPQGSSFLRALLESLPGIVYAIDTNLHYVFWNENLERVTGRSAAEIAQMTTLDIHPAEERDRIRERIARDFQDGVGGAETFVIAADGTRIPYSFSARRVTIDGSAYLVGMGLDITNLREAEEGLRHERLMFRAITESTRDMTTIVSRDGIITYESPAVERILGYRPEELVGKHVAEYLHPGELEAAMAILTTAIADGIPRDDPYDVRFRHKNGEYRLLAVTGGMLGEMGLVVSSRDITEQRARENEGRAAGIVRRTHAAAQS